MILRGDCLERMKELPDNSVDSIVTDPPYGLSFMGKKWDYDVPSVAVWKEALRVLKPGGHLLSFGGTRTYHRLVVAIEDAGFEIRDQIQWIYGSGFPKSHNIKEGAFKGFGTALKPANEPISVARKPLEGTVAANVEKWGTGAINIDASRVGAGYSYPNGAGGNSFSVGEAPSGSRTTPVVSTLGRWPANVIFDEEAGKLLDEQSGAKSKEGEDRIPSGNGVTHGKMAWRPNLSYESDSGGASRFFYCAKASKSERNAGLEGMPEKVLATSTGQTRPNKPARLGAAPHAVQDPVANFHPTVKPLKLMEYLIRLVTQPGGTVLDPFMGSGTTGVAAVKLGFNFIGIELNEEYVEIAKRRIG